jgi:tryptophan synthase alpha chain
MAACVIEIEALPDGRYRATSTVFPELASVGATRDEARRAFEEAIGADLERRLNQPPANPIDDVFQRLQQEGRKAFIPFVTAGDPDLDTTGLLIRELVRRGANLVEIGFPYSDPIADGAVIQASYSRALSRGVGVDDIFSWVRRLVASPESGVAGIPLVAMVSYSLVHHRGPEAFVAEAQAAGFSGAIIPDLPVEEAESLTATAVARRFKLIQLITPTTPRDRAVRIARLSSGFIYCVAVTGITGERERLPEELLDQIRWLRGQTELPICVGFGISKPEHVRMLRGLVDGVIVGSALVKRLEVIGSKPMRQVIEEIGMLAQSLADALKTC